MMNTRKYTQFFVSMLALAVLAACANKNVEAPENTETANHFIEITQAQFEAGEMETGLPQQHMFETFVTANGMVQAQPQGKALVSSNLPGRIRTIDVNVGDYVSKGSVLYTVEGAEIIDLQQQFVESENQLQIVQAEYERQKVLSAENIAAQKTLLQAEGEFKTLQAKVAALKATLKLNGLQAEKIIGGEMSPVIQIVAPISGHVTELNGSIGQFCEPQQMVFELVNTNMLQLRIAIFPSDVPKLEEGQKIQFSLAGNNEIFEATLSKIGKTVDEASKTITCIASISKTKTTLAEGSFVIARIVTSKLEIPALPMQAIHKIEGGNFVLEEVKFENNTHYFQKTKVETIVSDNGFTALQNAENLKPVLVIGGYNLVMD